MFKKQYIIIVFFVFIACKSDEKVLPIGLIGEDQMVHLITDIELTQAFIKLRMAEADSINQTILYENVFEKHSVTKEEFNESLKYYTNTPGQLETIYNKVIVKLSERQAENQKIR